MQRTLLKHIRKKKLFIFKRFLLISDVKSLKKVWNEQKRLKKGWKNVSTSFWVRPAPKSWSKYTKLLHCARASDQHYLILAPLSLSLSLSLYLSLSLFWRYVLSTNLPSSAINHLQLSRGEICVANFIPPCKRCRSGLLFLC